MSKKCRTFALDFVKHTKSSVFYVRLNENGAPIKAIAYVAHNEQWATFNWVRNDQEKPDYWDAPKRFALPKNVRRK